MSNATKNAAFLNLTTPQARTEILKAIAKHYGVSESAALAEVTDPEAEHLCDYLTGGTREATSLLMKRHGVN